MKALLLVLALALPAWAQDKTAPKKKPAAKPSQVAHKKPTSDQIRKFNQLEKKQQANEPKKK